MSDATETREIAVAGTNQTYALSTEHAGVASRGMVVCWAHAAGLDPGRAVQLGAFELHSWHLVDAPLVCTLGVPCLARLAIRDADNVTQPVALVEEGPGQRPRPNLF